MSAFIVSDTHINTLATAFDLTCYSSMTAQDVAEILLAENTRSVNYRYSDDEAVSPIEFKTTGLHATAVQILKLCASFAYQACETNDWEASKAFEIIERIKDASIRRLPGFEEAAYAV